MLITNIIFNNDHKNVAFFDKSAHFSVIAKKHRTITIKLRCGLFFYLFAFIVNVAPQLFRTSTEEKPASSKASVSCSTVNGVS